ncbi:glycosyltransferase family 4 protein [Aureimonas pseudogalii]|uniref:Glycosyltransferase involved in cell wall biosynthesis n=1 Tax=Aureimonas pseudogalii TaxID=1744844 RepID=A0A7W6MK35_9HYPH|nr:glycosyltransferase family 4 protein [Aureimonas pseudogalii]MBB3998789.1 glycosyltransferase involved in cell wall biosynthesis [Aureimonas pseudogalii]
MNQLSQTPARPRLLFVQTQAENAGAQEISRLVGEGLRARGYDVHHLFFYRVTDGSDALPNVVFVSRERPAGAWRFARFLLRLRAAIRRVRPDVVLTFQHYGNVLAAPAARLAGVPHVIANHVSARATVNGVVRQLDRALGLARIYDRITVNSHDLARDYAAYPERYRRLITHVPHGFEAKTTVLAQAGARLAFGLPVEASIIGCVSRLHPLKQIDHAIRILPALPEVHLAVAGQGPDAPRLAALARELGVADRFHTVGELPASRIGAFLRTLDLFVFTTAAETFGLAAVEAAQAGVPVVANDIPVLREVLAVDGAPAAAFVHTARTSDFAAAVEALLARPEGAEALRARGRRLAESYSLDAMIDAYEAMIVEAVLPEGRSR